MKNLLETNIYEPKGKVMICGTCLPKMEPVGYAKIEADFDMIMSVCLERDHINMALSKICAILSTGQITQLIFASVDNSPHCVQLHYLRREIKRVMDNAKLPPIFDFIIKDGELHLINNEVISLSKSLVELSKIVEKNKEIKLS